MNVSNGGLIALLSDSLFICDLSKYSGTYIMPEDGCAVRNMGAVMWFAAPDGHGLYCSNQRNHDFLTYLDGKTMDEACVLERACANIFKRGGTLLFIDEEDDLVYEYDKARKRCSLVIKEEVLSFILVSDTVYFASESGLKRFDLKNRRTEKLNDCLPLSLNFVCDQLIFADRNRDCALCKFDIGKKKLVVFDDVQTQSVITTKEHIFASNLADGNSIVRVSIETGGSIRFCGESADKLHIIGKYLYFINHGDNNSWYKVSLSGGRPVLVLTPQQ